MKVATVIQAREDGDLTRVVAANVVQVHRFLDILVKLEAKEFPDN